MLIQKSVPPDSIVAYFNSTFAPGDFCNKIGTFETSTDVCYAAAFGGTADIGPTSPQGRVVFDPNRSWGSGIRRTGTMEY
jgi:hypothetical protein